MGRAKWRRHVQTVDRMWREIRAGDEALALDYGKVQLYQDGLPNCGHEPQIVRDLARAGMPRGEAVYLEYRNKRWRGWPGDVYVRSRDGRDHFLDRSARMIGKDTFTPARCRLCFDKLNVLSDLAVGDGWGLTAGREDQSVVLVRTSLGQEVLDSAARAGVVRPEAVDPTLVFKGQAAERRRLEWTAYTALWRKMGREPPQFGIEPRWQASLEGVDLRPFRRRLGWAVRLEQAGSRQEALRMARRYIFLTEVLRRLTLRRVLAALWRRVKRLW